MAPERRWGYGILGLGIGALVDGFVLHQLLQWHHLWSSQTTVDTVEGLEHNTLADGIFHAVTWLVTLAGSLLAVKAWRGGELAPPWRAHGGALLAGWGAFNLVEGTIDHLILGIHHVRDDLGGPIGWDIGFLVVSAALAAVGAALIRSAAVSDGARAPARADRAR